MADGGTPSRYQRLTQRAAPYLVGTALTFNAAQQQDQRNYNPDDAGLSDQSIGGAEEQRESVLTPGATAQSYTGGQAEVVEAPIAGGGLMESSGMEFQRMLQQQEQMRRTQEQLVGAPSEGVEAGPPEARPTRAPARAAPEEAPSEEAFAQELQAQQGESFRQRVAQEATNRVKQQMQKFVEQQAQRLAQRGTMQGVRFSVEGAELATAETVVPLVALILEMNVQLVYTYFFEDLFSGAFGEDVDSTAGALLKQTFPETVATLGIDAILCCSAPCTNPCCQPIVFLAAIVAIIAVVLKKVGL